MLWGPWATEWRLATIKGLPTYHSGLARHCCPNVALIVHQASSGPLEDTSAVYLHTVLVFSTMYGNKSFTVPQNRFHMQIRTQWAQYMHKQGTWSPEPTLLHQQLHILNAELGELSRVRPRVLALIWQWASHTPCSSPNYSRVSTFNRSTLAWGWDEWIDTWEHEDRTCISAWMPEQRQSHG